MYPGNFALKEMVVNTLGQGKALPGENKYNFGEMAKLCTTCQTKSTWDVTFL